MWLTFITNTSQCTIYRYYAYDILINVRKVQYRDNFIFIRSWKWASYCEVYCPELKVKLWKTKLFANCPGFYNKKTLMDRGSGHLTGCVSINICHVIWNTSNYPFLCIDSSGISMTDFWRKSTKFPWLILTFARSLSPKSTNRGVGRAVPLSILPGGQV